MIGSDEIGLLFFDWLQASSCGINTAVISYKLSIVPRPLQQELLLQLSCYNSPATTLLLSCYYSPTLQLYYDCSTLLSWPSLCYSALLYLPALLQLPKPTPALYYNLSTTTYAWHLRYATPTSTILHLYYYILQPWTYALSLPYTYTLQNLYNNSTLLLR